MNIIVFIKQVPDTETRIKIGAAAKSIDEADVSWIISPYDEYALEEALKIKEARGAGKVTVVSAGPERASASTTTPGTRAAPTIFCFSEKWASVWINPRCLQWLQKY